MTTLRLTEALREWVENPDEEHRWAVVRQLTPLAARDHGPTDDLAALVDALLAGSRLPDEATLTELAFLELALQPSGKERANGNGKPYGVIVPPDLADVLGNGRGSDVQWVPGTSQAARDLALERGYGGPAAASYAASVDEAVRRSYVQEDARRLLAAAAAGPMQWESLEHVYDDDYRPVVPTMLRRDDGRHLIYPGAFHLVYSPPGVAKTWVALWLCLERMRHGSHVMFLDWESTADAIGGRMKLLGATREELSLFHYTKPGSVVPATREELARYAPSCEVCVIDGVAKSLAASGWDEDRAPDVLAWLVALVDPISAAGCAVVALDHVTKAVDARDWARGSGAKQGEVSGAAYELRRGEPYNRWRAGYVSMVLRKDREGQVGEDGTAVAEVHFRPRPHTLEVAVRTPSNAAKELARATWLERLWAAVQNVTSMNMTATTTSVKQIMGGDRSAIGAGLAELAELGHLRHEKGPRGADRWYPVAPYRAPAPEPPA